MLLHYREEIEYILQLKKEKWKKKLLKFRKKNKKNKKKQKMRKEAKKKKRRRKGSCSRRTETGRSVRKRRGDGS